MLGSSDAPRPSDASLPRSTRDGLPPFGGSDPLVEDSLLAHPEETLSAASDVKLRVGVLDLGSTSFHLLVSDANGVGVLDRVTRRRVRLCLGSRLSPSGEIPAEVCAESVESACALAAVAAECGCDRFVVVATAALRDARNGAALGRRIGKAIGMPVRLLKGEEEARLIFAAFRRRMPLDSGLTLGADLGGGSLELAIGDDSELVWETTLPLGATRLHGELVQRDPIGRREQRAICERARRELEASLERITHHAPRHCIVSGGTVRALAQLLMKSRDARHWRSDKGMCRITRRELNRLARLLSKSSHDERLAMPGMKRNRADQLPTGALILRTLLEVCEQADLIACDWGLREGVVLEQLGLASCEAPRAASGAA
jgi:exopolyphosphatase / guanosine-5'-triphosphate,3'-diphosphate pyrophosphatase